MKPPIDTIQEWLDWLSISSSPLTLEAYRWEMRHLETWAARDVLTLTKSDISRYLAERRELHHVGDLSIRRSLNALKSFYIYAVGKSKSPVKTLVARKVKRRRQRTLNREQAFAVMSAPDTSTATGKRDLALICLGLSSGLRAAELCRLRLADLDLSSGCLKVQIKGGDDGDGIFGSQTASAIASWLSIRSEYAPPDVTTLFVSVGGIKKGQPLTTSGLRCIFRSIGRRAGLEHFSPHDLRRSFATLSHRFGAPSRIVQVAGRWHDLAQVEGYTMALEAKDFEPYDPVNRLMSSES
jgi:site-specific recombinase XerD